jgi:hypothetical protein
VAGTIARRQPFRLIESVRSDDLSVNQEARPASYGMTRTSWRVPKPPSIWPRENCRPEGSAFPERVSLSAGAMLTMHASPPGQGYWYLHAPRTRVGLTLGQPATESTLSRAGSCRPEVTIPPDHSRSDPRNDRLGLQSNRRCRWGPVAAAEWTRIGTRDHTVTPGVRRCMNLKR